MPEDALDRWARSELERLDREEGREIRRQEIEEEKELRAERYFNAPTMNIDGKIFYDSYKKILKTFNGQINGMNKKIAPIQFIERFNLELGLSKECGKLAYKILECAKKRGYNVAGKRPRSIASALLFIAAELNGTFRTKVEVSKIGQISVVSLSIRVKEIRLLIK